MARTRKPAHRVTVTRTVSPEVERQRSIVRAAMAAHALEHDGAADRLEASAALARTEAEQDFLLAVAAEHREQARDARDMATAVAPMWWWCGIVTGGPAGARKAELGTSPDPSGEVTFYIRCSAWGPDRISNWKASTLLPVVDRQTATDMAREWLGLRVELAVA